MKSRLPKIKSPTKASKSTLDQQHNQMLDHLEASVRQVFNGLVKMNPDAQLDVAGHFFKPDGSCEIILFLLPKGMIQTRIITKIKQGCTSFALISESWVIKDNFKKGQSLDKLKEEIATFKRQHGGSIKDHPSAVEAVTISYATRHGESGSTATIIRKSPSGKSLSRPKLGNWERLINWKSGGGNMQDFFHKADTLVTPIDPSTIEISN